MLWIYISKVFIVGYLVEPQKPKILQPCKSVDHHSTIFKTFTTCFGKNDKKKQKVVCWEKAVIIKNPANYSYQVMKFWYFFSEKKVPQKSRPKTLSACDNQAGKLPVFGIVP